MILTSRRVWRDNQGMVCAKSLLDSLRCPKADLITLRLVRETSLARYVRDGYPVTNRSDENRGVMVEVLREGNLAWAATSDLDIRSVQEALERADMLAASMAKRGVHVFDKGCRPPSRGSWSSPVRERYNPADSRQSASLNDLLISASHALKVSPKITTTSARLSLTDGRHQLVSTEGAQLEQRFSFVACGYWATAADGGVVQTRSWGKRGQAGMEFFEDESLAAHLSRVGHQALELLDARECPTETTDLVLMPDQMILQIHESIGHPLEIDRILGDERNYAGSSFVTLEDFGSLAYGSPLLNVAFDPGVVGQYASYGFDDNGCPATKEYLIRQGKLLRGLGGMESRLRSATPGVACARSSSWNRPPIDRMANVNLEPGTDSLDEIIAGIERGVLMETNRSWSIDDFRRKFQFGCEYAKLIENGKLTHTLRNPNYRGVTLPFWRSLKKVGDAASLRVFGVPYCGKGEPNQGLGVGHASPACLFENVEVFGGAR